VLTVRRGTHRRGNLFLEHRAITIVLTTPTKPPIKGKLVDFLLLIPGW